MCILFGKILKLHMLGEAHIFDESLFNIGICSTFFSEITPHHTSNSMFITSDCVFSSLQIILLSSDAIQISTPFFSFLFSFPSPSTVLVFFTLLFHTSPLRGNPLFPSTLVFFNLKLAHMKFKPLSLLLLP